MKAANLTSKIFGLLFVVQRAKNDSRGAAQWDCVCECGNLVTVRAQALQTGDTQSCGCVRKRNQEFHSRSQHEMYQTYRHMVNRCHNPDHRDYPKYGGRGITVCDEWRNSIENYLRDLPPRPNGDCTIDRINNDDGYHPGNIRWASDLEQARNRRSTHRIIFDGREMSMREFSRFIGVSHTTVLRKVELDWTIDEIAEYYNGNKNP